MIVVTGASGFIGSCLVGKLNQEGHTNLVIVDDFSRENQLKNLEGKQFDLQIERDVFIDWFASNAAKVDFVYHIGARTDTAEFDYDLLNRLNLDYTKSVWKICTEHQIPLVYASSAATYGLGEFGYDDDESKIDSLVPLNPYGDSKNEFDKWALKQDTHPPLWAGMKFFNVYGPNEYHKGRMASVIFHTFNQIQATGKMKLFQSHRDDIKNGEQMRDFVYVKDVVSVLYFFLTDKPKSGIYNLGSGTARSFFDLASNTFTSLGKETDISFIPIPEDIRDKYQYFTEATMDKVRAQGYTQPFHTLEEGVKDYVQNYLSTSGIY